MAASNFRGSPLQRTGIINGTCFREDSSQSGSDRPSPVQQNKVSVTSLAPRYVLRGYKTSTLRSISALHIQ